MIMMMIMMTRNSNLLSTQNDVATAMAPNTALAIVKLFFNGTVPNTANTRNEGVVVDIVIPVRAINSCPD